MNTLVSMIVPVYNVENYLKRCVDSIINQSYTHIEIILVDDGSTDSSGKLCDEYAKLDSRIHVIHKENGGLSSARNAGLDIMRGEYVMFVDSDDYIAPDCVAYLYDLIADADAQISIGNYEMTNEDSYSFRKGQNRIVQMTGTEAIAHQFGKNTVQYVSAWAKLYNSDVFKELRFPEGLLHEDEGTTYKALYQCNQIIVSDRVVYAYYCNPKSITKMPRKKNYEDLCAVLNEQIRFFHEQDEVVLEARVKNRYCIQAAAHYLPKGYYAKPKDIVRNAKRMYKGIWKIKNIPIIERLKGGASTYFCGIVAKLMYMS